MTLYDMSEIGNTQMSWDSLKKVVKSLGEI